MTGARTFAEHEAECWARYSACGGRLSQARFREVYGFDRMLQRLNAGEAVPQWRRPDSRKIPVVRGRGGG